MDVADAMTYEERILRALKDKKGIVTVLADSRPAVMNARIMQAFGIDGLPVNEFMESLNDLVEKGQVTRRTIHETPYDKNSNIYAGVMLEEVRFTLVALAD